MITAAQLRAARALVGMDQKTLAEKAGVSLPTIQRMEASIGNVRGVVETLTKIVAALDAARLGIGLVPDRRHRVEVLGDPDPAQRIGADR